MQVCRLSPSGSEHVAVEKRYDNINEAPGSIKGGEFLDQLNDYQFHEKDSTA
jgi:hypothetical protein